MFRPHGAPRARHLRPLASSTTTSITINPSVPTTASTAVIFAAVPASAPAPAVMSFCPALVPRPAPIVSSTRPRLHSAGHQAPLSAPPRATTSPSYTVHHCAQNDVPRLASLHSSYSRLSCRTPYPRLPLHPLHHSSHPPALSVQLGPLFQPASPHGPLQARGKKTKTTIRLSDLPQGLLRPVSSEEAQSRSSRAPDPLPQHEPAYPTVVLQVRQHMRKYSDCVLLTRVGSFYELYFEHAEEYGPLLNLKVASKKTNAGQVPMAGFPFHQLDRFLKILVQDYKRHVAVAEEFPNSTSDRVKYGGLMHDRRVARIITPGTLIDENFMDPYSNNYVMAIHVHPGRVPSASEALAETAPPSSSSTPTSAHSPPSHVRIPGEDVPLGLAWLDLSTGHFGTQQANLASLPSILSRLCPHELVLDQDLESQPHHSIFPLLADDRHLVTYSAQGGLQDPSDWSPMLEEPLSPAAANSFAPEEVLAADLVLNYVKNRLQGLGMKLQPPLRHQNMQSMAIDKNTLRALEVKQTFRDGAFRGSLLHAIRRTVTKSGARLLNEWLSAPSTSLDVITARQDLVARFVSDADLRDTIIILLRRSHDSQRLVQKFALGRGDADDLLALANTIAATKDITVQLQAASSTTNDLSNNCLKSLASRLESSLAAPIKLAHRIRDAIDEDGLIHQHEIEESEVGEMRALAEHIESQESLQVNDDADEPPLKPKKKRPTSIREYYTDDNESWIMKPAASRTLKRLHEELRSLLKQKGKLNEQFCETLGAPSLTLRWTPSLGHIAHVKGKDAKYLTGFKALSASRSTRSFHLPEWAALGQNLDQVRAQIRAEEQAVFASLREQVVLNLVKLRRHAAVLAELDVTTSFAKLALEQNLVRPVLNNTTCHTIVGGRHPTVEGGLFAKSRSFVRNDCLVGSPMDGRVWFITGPNMAGKSTFLRQNALITILAQIGCYVPASYAELGIVDAIFSRVGSADNLYRDESTFMVEMLETAQILKQATPRSFVIMDEVGRGTTPEDGTAVSFACLHHLATVNQCRTLFASHFHAVADLAAAEGLCEDGGIVQMYCTDVGEDGDGGFVYVHRLRKGINRKSHALKVAKLAGLPEQAVKVAQLVLNNETPGMML